MDWPRVPWRNHHVTGLVPKEVFWGEGSQGMEQGLKGVEVGKETEKDQKREKTPHFKYRITQNTLGQAFRSVPTQGSLGPVSKMHPVFSSRDLKHLWQQTEGNGLPLISGVGVLFPALAWRGHHQPRLEIIIKNIWVFIHGIPCVTGF